MPSHPNFIYFMKFYYVNKNPQIRGEHEVHSSDCIYLPAPENRQYLGYFNSCAEAVKEARRYYTNVDGCFYCCPLCHTK